MTYYENTLKFEYILETDQTLGFPANNNLFSGNIPSNSLPDPLLLTPTNLGGSANMKG